MIQTLAAVAVYTLVAFIASSVGRYLGRSAVARRVQKWFTGDTYIALGAGLALSGHKR